MKNILAQSLILILPLASVGFAEDSSENTEIESLAQQNFGEEEDKSIDIAEGTEEADDCFAGRTDFINPGPYEVERKSMGGQTVYYPVGLPEGCLFPLASWGNGSGVFGTGTYAHFHRHLASWGIFVAASSTPMAGSGYEIRRGVDILLEGEFSDQLNGKAGTFGHSQGGGGAINAASHEAVEAVVGIQSCTMASGDGFTKPGLYVTGTLDTCRFQVVGHYNQHSGPAYYANYSGATHVSTPTQAGDSSGSAGTKHYRRISTAWFLCFLSDLKPACDLFNGGEEAPVGKDGNWAELRSKNLD